MHKIFNIYIHVAQQHQAQFLRNILSNNKTINAEILIK